MPSAEHYGPGDGTGWLTPADELEDIELGDRVGLWLTNWQLCTIYTYERDKIFGAVCYMVGAVASVTSHRGLPFPAEWWPPGPVERAA
jgi:hypothetical protein